MVPSLPNLLVLQVRSHVPPADGMLAGLAAAAFLAWYGLVLWAWSRYRAANQAWYQVLRGGWVLLNREAFRTEGWRWLALVRWTFVLIVLPLIAGVLLLSPR